MATTMRSRSVMGGALAALGVALASVAWACTPTMTANNWFCPNNTACGASTVQSFTAGAMRYSSLRGASPSGLGLWDVRYITGTGNHALCMSSTSYIAGTFNAENKPAGYNGWSKVAVSLPSTPGNYSTCATYPAGAIDNATEATETDRAFTIL